MILNITFAHLTIVLATIFNTKGLVDGPPPTVLNFILTILFLVLWFSFGIFRGRERKKSFLIFAIIFWAIALGTTFIVMHLGPNPLVMVNFAIMAPVNGFMFLEFMRSQLFFAAMFLPLIITCIGYLVGLKIISSQNNL
ncbi:hypothetical protein DEAC_c42770 [Desulfosporosinus acididurans]|uniref:Uncharacterized protein n=1 Tax=Desulfosporosinus acididurans TaxID=476652 RepID=A0A0J1IGG4_9FIRM|nr:hypothetical protein DEAC_c42770 [Desulfosporosinus acididurans]